MRTLRPVAFVVGLAAISGCAAIGDLARLIQPPRFTEPADRRPELRLLPPSSEHHAGGAAVRLWTEVENPNSFGVTLTYLGGTLFLEEARAASADFPLGLPLGARARSVIPLDLSVSLADVPGLRVALDRAVRSGAVRYRLEGTVAVDTGPFGERSFGPLTMLSGDLNVLGVLSGLGD
jgi:hypothetical protein